MPKLPLLYRCYSMVCGVGLLCAPLCSRPPTATYPFPDQFVMGRDSFFDVGPPFDYYEVISVKPEQQGSRVDRILITPPTSSCTSAKVEVSSGFLSQSAPGLLEGRNPCSIPEKELHKELKRCKSCLVFSRVDVTMQAQCTTGPRQIRMEILDRDIYDAGRAKTPNHTSWTERLLGRLDKALGPGPMEKPILDVSPSSAVALPKIAALDDVASGKFDSLFGRSHDKLSDLYKQAQHPPPPPSVQLVSSQPFSPSSFQVPKYPPLARAARVSGSVGVVARVTEGGKLADLKFIDGHPLLRNSVETAVLAWVYSNEAAGKEVRVTLKFEMNCTSEANQ